ncbi:MAG TPA: hypothetical protein VLZ05_16615 [Mycobacterium sp.]|nr:hypothetical protein [Mycobacterium sp.]HUH70333.1 hypothetical protein [Mycobacterium sp.]
MRTATMLSELAAVTPEQINALGLDIPERPHASERPTVAVIAEGEISLGRSALSVSAPTGQPPSAAAEQQNTGPSV